MRKATQTERILDRLKSGASLTQDDADRMYPKIKRLAARIRDIKDMGYEIAERRVTTLGGAKVSQYKMVFDRDGQGTLIPLGDMEIVGK